jgi:integrase
MPTLKQILALPLGRRYCGQGLLIKTTPISRTLTRGRKTTRTHHTWMFRYKNPITGKYTETSIGDVFSFDHADANNEMYRMRQLLAKGLDPVQEKRKQRASRITFGEVCDKWIETQRSSWSEGQMRNVELFLKKHGKSLAAKSVAHVDSNMVEDAIRPLWAKAPKQAKRTARMWKRVFAYAIHKKFYTGDNPAIWEGNLSNVFPKSKDTNRNHHAAMPYQQVPRFMRELRQHQNRSTAAVALEFCILTASRPGEVRGMQWSEVEAPIWTIPTERMKARKEHRVPLSDRALELLTRQKDYSNGSPFVFTGYNGISLDDTSLRKFLRGMGVPFTVHGFRTTFRTWAAEQTDFDFYVVEMCLAHSVGNAVTRAYLRGDALEKRRIIMQAWADFCG